MDFRSPSCLHGNPPPNIPHQIQYPSLSPRAHCSHGLNGEWADPVAPAGEVPVLKLSAFLSSASADMPRLSCFVSPVGGGIGVRLSAGHIPD